jgi:hypothetical protein
VQVQEQVDGEAEVDRGGGGGGGGLAAEGGSHGGGEEVIKSHHSFTLYTGKKFLVTYLDFFRIHVMYSEL